MKKYNRETGIKGEEIAIKLLRKKGFKILQSNFSTKFGEIDIVAVDNKKLVFVEVKAKKGEDFGTPEEMVDQRKLRQVQNTAMSYLLKNPEIDSKYSQYRIDVVAVVFDKDYEVLRSDHYENVY